MRNSALKTFLAVLLLVLAGCAAPPKESPTDPYAGYPVEIHNGKRVHVVPAADVLMRAEVPVPVAPAEEGISIRVSLFNQRAWLYQDGMLVLTSAICPGKPGFETRAGNFHVVSKHAEWVSTVYHVPMPYFLRFNPGDFGLHEGIVAFQPSSHGCIRLPKGMAQAFFEATPVGAKVIVTRD